MSTCLIAYFSLGGTTARVAESIATGLRADEYQVDLCNIKDAKPPDPGGYDLLGIGLPAYYFSPPVNVMDYLNSLPDLNGLPAFVFVVHGTLPGDTGTITRRLLAQKGAKDAGYFQCHGADFFLGYLKEGYFFSPDHPTEKELHEAEEFGRKVAAAKAGQEYSRPKDDPGLGFIYRMEQFLMNPWLIRNVYGRMFTVKKDKCTACGLCMKECPTGNISADKEGRPVWGHNCLLCVNCEMKCPENAIKSPVSWPIFHPTILYNVYQASRDSSLDHVRVKHDRGTTSRV